MEILKSDISREAKTEIVKFFTLPRNTPVVPIVELPDEEQRASLGAVSRPTQADIHDREHPEEAEEKKAIGKTLKGRVGK